MTDNTALDRAERLTHNATHSRTSGSRFANIPVLFPPAETIAELKKLVTVPEDDTTPPTIPVI